MKSFLKLAAALQHVGYDNSLDDWVPEVWSLETLSILEENMVIGNIVWRDFEDEIKSFGDTVNTRRPNQYVAKRKGANDEVTEQDSSATNIAVVLNQHIHTSFNIKDTEETLALDDLIRVYLRPAALSIARKIDKILLGQVHQFYVNRDPGATQAVGDLGGANASNIKSLMLSVGKQLDKNRCPDTDRWLLVDPETKQTILENDSFVTADKVGDDGTQLREASLGRILGFNVVMGQNTPRVETMTTTVDADELASDVAVGDTVINVDLGTNFTVGEYITLEGDLMPYRIIAINTNALTLNRPARRVVLASASDITTVTLDTVDLAGHVGVSAYPVGYDKEIKVDASAQTPQEGAMVSFNTGTTVKAAEYSITDVTVSGADTYIELDRALEEAVLDGDTAGYSHAGSYCFALHPEALAMVMRPLVQPRSGAGAVSGVAEFNNLAMRTTITYDGKKQKHLVTLDVLFGTKVLEENYAVPMLA